MEKRNILSLSNLSYVVWFIFYFLITWGILGGSNNALLLSFIIYGVSIGFALSPIGEHFFRITSGIRPLVLNEETEIIAPIFQEVYDDAQKQDSHINSNVKLYIQDTMEVNACAIGRTTVAVTKGAMQFMNADELRGLFAHELGHLANGDTIVLLLTNIGNGIFNIVVIIGRWIIRVVQRLAYTFEGGPLYMACWLLGSVIEFIIFIFIFVGEIILMASSRKSEYLADQYAHDLGYGNHLLEALEKLQKVTTTGRRSIMSLLKATHPSLVNRILRLQSMAKVEGIDEVIT